MLHTEHGEKKMKIYVASSWRNDYQQTVVTVLREAGHSVYDFRNPPNGTGFSWGEIDPDWKQWSKEDYLRNLSTPQADRGFNSDWQALQWADAIVLVLPCNRSAHLELGVGIGWLKHTCILLDDTFEPELMYKGVDRICTNLDDVVTWLMEAEKQGTTLC